MLSEDALERTIGGLALAFVGIGCAIILWPFGTSLIWAAIIVFSTWPVFRRAERMLGGRRSAAAALMTLLAAALLLAPVALLVNHLAEQVAGLISLIQQWLEAGPPQPPDWVATVPLIGKRAFERWQGLAQDHAAFTAALTPYLKTGRDLLLSLGASIGSGIGRLLLSLIVAFFLYCHGESIVRRLNAALFRVGGARAGRLGAVAGEMVRGVVYGVLGTNLIEAILAGIGFWIVEIPGALLLGTLCFFFSLVPLGPTLIWLPAAIWLVSRGETGWAIFLGAYSFFVFTILENVLRAYLVGRSSEMPMILILLGMLGGVFTFGLLGLFVGPTLLAIGYALFDEWSLERSSPSAAEHAAEMEAVRTTTAGLRP
jgi:predicted PurR-regulated permease PerM